MQNHYFANLLRNPKEISQMDHLLNVKLEGKKAVLGTS